MFWIIFTIFFAVLFSIFFLIPDSSKKKNDTDTSSLQSQLEANKKKELASVSKSMDSSYKTYIDILTQMSAEKKANINNSRVKKISIRLNNLLTSTSEIPKIITEINQLSMEGFKPYFVYSSENIDGIAKDLLTQLQETYNKSNFLSSKTPEGVVSVVRQLNPRLHLDSSLQLLIAMKNHLNRILFVNSQKSTWEQIAVQHNQKNNIYFSEDCISAVTNIKTINLVN